MTITQNKQGLKVLITGSILQLFLGIIYVWSIFVIPVNEVYEWDIVHVKFTASFMLCFFVAGILIGGKLQSNMSAPKIVLLGGLMLSIGMFTTAFLPSSLAWLMYITYGVIGGFGVGAAYNTILSAAQKWFPQNRGFAVGVVICAFGASTVIFAPLVEALVGQFGLRHTFIILAVVFLIIVLALFRFVRLPDEDNSASAPSATLLAQKQYSMSEALQTKKFYLIPFSLMFVTAAFFVLNPSFKIFAIERGLSESIGTAVVMLVGVANTLGRLGTPLLSDKIGREKATLSIILATAVCALLLCFAEGLLFMATIAVIAYCFGGAAGIYPVLTADHFGVKNIGAIYGAVMAGFALSALIFPMTIGLITNDMIKFIVLALFACGAGVLVILLSLSKKRMES
jgi:OFA family oxalate/formate antiporter-like MFS transporter